MGDLTLVSVYPEFNNMVKVREEDLKAISAWIQEQKFLPENLGDGFLRSFLSGCDGNLNETKQVLCNYFYARQSIPEIFTKRDPLLKENLSAWKASCFIPLKEKHDGCRVFFATPLNANCFDFTQLVKQAFMCFDLMLQINEWDNGDRIIIISYDNMKYQSLATYTIYTTRKAIECGKPTFLPGKTKAIHNIHIPPFMKKIYERFQPYLTPEDEKIVSVIMVDEVNAKVWSRGCCSSFSFENIMKREQVFASTQLYYGYIKIHFHKSLRSLHKYVNPEILPLEYGGNAGPLKVIKDKWYEVLKDHRSFFVQEEEKRVQETKLKVAEFKGERENYVRKGIDLKK